MTDDAWESDFSVMRDAGSTLVAALEESDTTIDASQDAIADAGKRKTRRRLLTLGGLLLAVLSVFVVRKKRH